MNFGTPQEVIDEEKENNPNTPKEDLFGCLVYIVYLVICYFIIF
jgi:hypothetical protein